VKRIACILMVAILAGLAFGQATPDEGNILKMLEQSKTYYNTGEYEKAIAELERALNVLYKLKQNDRVEAYKYLGYSYVAFGDVVKAKESFKRALSINPDLKLDPATVSPKIIQVFEQARAEMPKTVVGDTIPEEPAYKRVDYAGAALRSAVLPGWGQMYKGDVGKGRIVMIGALSSLGGAIVSGILEKKTHNAYRNDPNGGTYGTYNFFYNITRICLVGFAGTWLFGVFDAAMVRPSGHSALNLDRQSDLAHRPTTLQFNIGVTKRF